MMHEHEDGLGPVGPGRDDGRPSHDHHHRHGHRHKGRHGGRLFDYGELRLLVLAMIAEQPRHGYELMRAFVKPSTAATAARLTLCSPESAQPEAALATVSRPP